MVRHTVRGSPFLKVDSVVQRHWSLHGVSTNRFRGQPNNENTPIVACPMCPLKPSYSRWDGKVCQTQSSASCGNRRLPLQAHVADPNGEWATLNGT